MSSTSTSPAQMGAPRLTSAPASTDRPTPPALEIEWPLRVLIVDDAASTRRLIRAVLESSPRFDVAGVARNGATAIKMAESLQPDVVLLDLSMPLVDGPTALGALLQVAPNVRVIVLSGSDAATATPLLAAGAMAFVPKGLAPSELLETLGGILGHSVTAQGTASHNDIPADTPKPSPQAQPRAVICDDDTMTRRLVTQVLANCDVPVIAETDGVPNLLAVIGLAKPELVVLDLWLEGTTGTSALPEIRRVSPRTMVVVYSAHEEWKDKALAGGAAAFVAKPHFDELEAAIRRFMPTPASPI